MQFVSNLLSRLRMKALQFLGLPDAAAKPIIEGAVKIGQNFSIDPSAEIIATFGGEVIIGDSCFIQKGTVLYPIGGKILIGDRVGFGPYCVIYGHGGLTIGNDVRIATSCIIIPANHNFEHTDISISQQGETAKGIVIEDDVWIGARVTILDGITIGRGSVIGAGSLVKSNIPAYSVAVGSPAEAIKKRK